MNLAKKNIYVVLMGILAICTALFIPNQWVGLSVCILLACTVLLSEKIGILFLILFIPIRPVLIAINPGLKYIGDIILIFLVCKTFFNYRRNIKQLFTFNIFELALFGFAITGTISALITGVAPMAIIIQLRAFLLFYLLYYVVKRLEIKKEDLNAFIIATFGMSTLICIFGIVEKLSDKTLLWPESWVNSSYAPINRFRVYGLIGGPNELALYLIIAFILSLYLLPQVKGKWKRFIYVGLILTQTIVLLAYSRGTMLTLLAFVPIYFIFNKRIEFFKKIVVTSLVACIMFFVIGKVSPITATIISNMQQEKTDHAEKQNNNNKKHAKNNDKDMDRYKNAFSKDTVELSTADGRLFYVKKAIEVFKDRPIIGYGFGTFGGSATLMYSSPIYEKYNIGFNFYSDNQYIQLLAETGLVGVIFCLIFVITLGITTWKARNNQLFFPILSYLFIAAIVGSGVYNILENDSFMMYYFLALGCLSSYMKNNPIKYS